MAAKDDLTTHRGRGSGAAIGPYMVQIVAFSLLAHWKKKQKQHLGMGIAMIFFYQATTDAFTAVLTI